jgi:hypothetical protein
LPSSNYRPDSRGWSKATRYRESEGIFRIAMRLVAA